MNRSSYFVKLSSALLVLFVAALATSARAVDIDWAKVEGEATNFLSDYVKVDTTNPPGNEIAAARFLADRFASSGIAAEVFESEPGRGSVIARVAGTGGARPLILLNHLDVVPANPTEWESPPFSGTVRNGAVYGRGTLDCKGVGTVDAMVLMLLKREEIALKRDVIFLGTADEETGGKLGAGWMVDHHLDKLGDAEFLLNEGGHIHTGTNGKKAYEVAVSEKTPCWLRLTATGKPGHGSAPPRVTSVTALVRALERLAAYKAPILVTPEVQSYYAALAPMQSDDQRNHFADLRGALKNDVFRQHFLGDAHNAAMVQNTLTPTVLTAGQKTNVIPKTATAELDCRLLPGQNPADFLKKVTEVIDDPSIQIETLLNFPPSASPTDTALYRTLQRMAERDRSAVVPSVLTGFTDSHYFRDKGIVSYGFLPFTLNDEDTLGEHGLNEHLATEQLREGTRRLIDLLQMLDREGS
ncbi:MAG TPA: M20/M25/M40 family metallo-hydrolase [Candidatus Acidoferrales bacterium]|nr:M20/M25/M40 family metallo-hydrolase [Candidatus Acidoferrales bacterium]